jgi:hypothetical protein
MLASWLLWLAGMLIVSLCWLAGWRAGHAGWLFGYAGLLAGYACKAGWLEILVMLAVLADLLGYAGWLFWLY